MTKLPKSRTEYVECGKSRVVEDVWDKDRNPIHLTIVGGSPPPSAQDLPPSVMSTSGEPRVQPSRREDDDEVTLAEISPSVYALAVGDVTGGLLDPNIGIVFTPDFAQRLGIGAQRQAVVWNTAQVIDGQLVLDLPQGFTPSATGDMTFVIGLGQD
jgi:hypothetical protein